MLERLEKIWPTQARYEDAVAGVAVARGTGSIGRK